MIVQEPVQAAIWHCLNHYAYQDATFLAERLCSEVETDETLFTLATCYYRSNDIHQAYWVLHSRRLKTPQCKFLLAKCAYDLKKYSIVEKALTNDNFIELKHLEKISTEFGEVACFALQLIAKVCTQTERPEIAAEANTRALKLNPFLWESFADLCNRGHKPDPKVIFQLTNTDTFMTCQGHNVNSTVAFGGSTVVGSGVGGGFVGSGGGGAGGDIIDINNTTNNFQDQHIVTPTNNIRIDRQIINHIDDTPMATDSNFVECGGGGGMGTPFRKQFTHLQSFSPQTPSFGVLRINSSMDSPTLFHSPTHQQQQNQTPTLVEANEQKSISKKNKGQHIVGGLLLRNNKETPLQLSKPIFSQTGNITPRTPNSINSSMGTGGGIGGPNVRRSSRLSFSNYSSVKENNKSSAAINKFVTPRSPPRKTKQRITKMNLSNSALNELNEKQQKFEKEKIETITSAETQNKVLLNNSINMAQSVAQHVLQLRKQSAEGLMSLLRDLADGYLHLSQYNCKEAIEAFANVPQHHYLSSWVQSMCARAHYEQRNYDAAANLFQEIHKKEPHRMYLMEIYSTVLWHLQREVALSALAQDLIAQDKSSPITWCVAGNCFSLHKEHETAIKFFERAVQVDPEYVYSYSLLGHELVTTEELEKAMSCFRTALLKDSRHYNAWFGIGTIYSKQERYNLAEMHYVQALRINPKNSVIMVHIGAMQFFLKKKDKALKTLNTAIELDPKNPLSKFHRGSMYFQMGRLHDALKELEELKQILPNESVVYYLIGKIHKKLGNVDSALMHFSWATDLDPKGANNQIKDAFDTNLCQCSTTSGPTASCNDIDGIVNADGSGGSSSSVGVIGDLTSERSSVSVAVGDEITSHLRNVDSDLVSGRNNDQDYDSDSY